LIALPWDFIIAPANRHTLYIECCSIVITLYVVNFDNYAIS
jgi:hypothetical protein